MDGCTLEVKSAFVDDFAKPTHVSEGPVRDPVRFTCFTWTNGFAPGDLQMLETFADAAFMQHTPGYTQTNGWDNTPPSATNAYYFTDRSVVALVIVLNAGYLVVGAVH